MALSLYFDRKIDVRIGPPGGLGRSWSDVRVEFSVERSLRKDPNTASISLYNLDSVSVGIIQTTGAVVQLLAGYGSLPFLLFSGDIARRGVTVERSGTDRIVTIEAGDGELAFTEARFNWHFEAGTPNATILSTILSTLGLGIAPGDPLPPYVYPLPLTFTGRASEALDRLCRDVGVSYSIQDGNVQILLPGSGRKGVAPLISPETGLVASPSQTDDGANFRCLLNGNIKPGSFVSLISETLSGFYKAEKVTHRGDTHGGDWTTEVEAVPVGT